MGSGLWAWWACVSVLLPMLCVRQRRGKTANTNTGKKELPQHDQHTSRGQMRLIGLSIIESESYGPRLSGLTYWLISLSTCCKHISSSTSYHSLTQQMINIGCLCDGVTRFFLKQECIFHNYINSCICPYSWRSAGIQSAILSVVFTYFFFLSGINVSLLKLPDKRCPVLNRSV